MHRDVQPGVVFERRSHQSDVPGLVGAVLDRLHRPVGEDSPAEAASNLKRLLAPNPCQQGE